MRRGPFAIAMLAFVLFSARSLAVTQPPHDAPGGTQCVQCHIPYGGVNLSGQASGSATAGSGTIVLVDSSKSWAVGAWISGVVTFTSGANLGAYRVVSASTATSLRWTEPLRAPLAVGDTYQIGKTTYDDVENKCRACHSATGSASAMADVGLHVVNGGATVIGCGKCHEPHNTDPNTGRGQGLLRLAIRWPTVKTALAYPGSPQNRFITTGPPYNGICQICHTQTTHHRNDGTGADHFPTMSCTDCHRHQDRFVHGGGGGGTNCGDCHGHDPGAPLPSGEVSLGAGSSQSHSTHTENDADDRRGPYLSCDQCHDTNAFPFFNAGTDLNGDGHFTLAETSVCEDCHSSSGTYEGVNDSVIGAKPNWRGGIYAVDNQNMQPGKERWCAGCHDESPSVIQGVQAPWVAGEESAPTAWGTTGYGFYKTGHGLPSGEVYPWTIKLGSNQQRGGAGLECTACHDSAVAHVDGVARTYSTMRTQGGFQAGYRLKSVGLVAPMQIPRVYQGTDPLVKPEDFPLCFGCHNPRPFTSPSTPIATNYRGDGAHRNAHNFHLGQKDLVFRSDWAYDASISDSRSTCITCHNVHGGTQLAMVNDGLLTGRGLTMSYADANGPVSGLALADSTGTAWHEYESRYTAANPAGLCSQGCHFNVDPNAWRTYDRLPYDVAIPQIAAVYGEATSALVSVRFSKGVFGPSGAALVVSDFVLVDSAGRVINSVDHIAGSTIAILTLSTSLGGGWGSDTLAPAISPQGYDYGGIYDALGNRVPQAAVTIASSDTIPPSLTITSPASGATGVAVDASLSFSLADAESGVLWSSVRVTLTGSKGYAASFMPGQISHTGSPASCSVDLSPPTHFGADEIITVSVQATDAMDNPLAMPAWTFTTTAVVAPVTVRLHPNAAGSGAGLWTVSPLNTWGTSLRTNDGIASYAQGTGSATTFYVNMDDPSVFEGAVQNITLGAVIKTSATSSFTLGWRVGAVGTSFAGQAVSVAGSPTLFATVSSPAWSSGLSLSSSDVASLQVFVTRSPGNTHIDQVTQLYVDVTYLP